MKIAQFITQYPYPNQFSEKRRYYCAGAGRVARELSEALVKKGHEVHAFASSENLQYENRIQNGVVVHRSPSIGQINTTEISPTILLDNFREAGFDLVHAHNSTPPGVLAAYLRSKLSKTPLVITHHGGENYEPHGGLFRRSGLFLYTRFMLQNVFCRASAVVVPSKGYISESRILPNKNVRVEIIRNGVELDDFQGDFSASFSKKEIGLDPDSFTILFLGAHLQRKGPDVLLRAFSKFSDENHSSDLVIGGSGELTNELKQLSRSLNVEQRVHFPGYIPESEKSIFFGAADVFVLPSVIPGAEMFPLVILEAAAAGTPVIASNFPTLRPIIQDYNIGLLTQPGSSSALAQSLTEFYNSDERQLYHSNALNMAANHSWDHISNDYVELYRDVI